MIDKWIYKICDLLDKFGLMIDNLFKIMSEIKMNYYFTGALIICFLWLAFCGGPTV